MKVIKKLAWVVLFLIIGLVVAAIVVPTIFKDEIMEKLKITMNDQLNAVVDFDDINISILSSFPNARVDIENLSVNGVDKFEDVKLYQADHTMLDVSLPSLIKDDIPYQLREVSLDHAQINIVKSKDGSANYEITKDSGGESASYTLDLKKYNLTNSKISYTDKIADVKLVITDLNHNGSGRFTENIYDLNTTSDSKSLTVTSGGVNYIYKANAKLDAIINIDVPNEKYTLKDNKLSLNELNLDADGYVQFRGEDMFVDVKLKGLENNFRSYLSVIPHAYVDQFSNVNTNGNGALTADIKGNYNTDKNIFPSIDLDFKISDAYVKYNNVAQAVEQIFATIQIDASEGNYDDMIVNIPMLKAKVGNDPIDAKITISDSSNDPKVDGYINADVDLSNWKSALPDEMITDTKGKVKANITFAGKVSDIESSNYGNLKMDGEIQMSDVDIKSSSSPEIQIKKGYIKASPEVLDIQLDKMQYGKSDMNVTSTIQDPLLLAINTDQPIVANLNIDAGTIDANELIKPAPITDEELENDDSSLFNIDASKIDLNAKADKIVYTDQVYTDVILKGDLDGDKINITKAQTKMNDNDISLTGRLENPMGYMEGAEVLRGNIELQSNKLNMNDFITESEDDTEAAVIIIPKDVDVNISATIKDLTYTNMSMSNSAAKLEIKNQMVNINSLKTNTLGGQIAMQGAYNTVDAAKPSFDMMLDFNKIQFDKAFEKMETIQKLAPVIKYVAGFFNSTLTFKGDLTDNMMPNLSSLDASGFVETFASSINNFSVLNGLGNKLGIEELKSFAIDNTKNWFEVQNGMVELKPRKFSIKNIDMAIAGTHGLGSDMQYVVEMKVPREMLKQNVVTGILDQGMSKVESEAAKFGITIGKGDYINLEIGITGDITSPKYSIKPVGYEAGDVKQAVQDEIDNQIDKAKDSIKTVINDTKETVKDTVKTVANEVVDSAKTVVNEKVNEVKDTVKSVINTQIDSLANKAGLDSLKNKVKDVLGNGADKEVDKIKDKIKGWNPFGKKNKKN